jgi:hypothetical protein
MVMAADEWTEASASEIVRELGQPRVSDRTAETVVHLMRSLDEEEQVLRLQVDPPPELKPGQLGMVLGRTRLFINKERARELHWDVICAGGVYWATHSSSLSTAAGLLRQFVKTIKLLDETELDLIAIITGTAATLPEAEMPVSQKQIERAFDGNQPQGLSRRLDSMVKRGVLKKGPGGYVVSP